MFDYLSSYVVSLPRSFAALSFKGIEETPKAVTKRKCSRYISSARFTGNVVCAREREKDGGSREENFARKDRKRCFQYSKLRMSWPAFLFLDGVRTIYL